VGFEAVMGIRGVLRAMFGYKRLFGVSFARL